MCTSFNIALHLMVLHIIQSFIAFVTEFSSPPLWLIPPQVGEMRDTGHREPEDLEIDLHLLIKLLSIKVLFGDEVGPFTVSR